MKLSINDRLVGIIFETKEEETLVKDFFTYNDMSLVFQGGSFNKNRIKKVSFLRKKSDVYFTDSGFLKELVLFSKDNNIHITEVSDKRTKFHHQEKEYTDDYLEKYFSYDYKEHQVRALKKLLKSNVGIIKAPTSSGKTSLFISFVKEINVPTIILFNKVLLVTQTYDRMIKEGVEDVGYCYGQGFKRGKVILSTIGSVYKIKNFSEYKCLIIDECHGAQTNEYQKFLENTSFPLRFGFSATPEGNKDKYKYALIRRYLGSVIEDITTAELLDNGVIARPIISFIPVETPKALDFASSYEAGIVQNDIRNRKIAKLYEEHDELPTLILIRRIEHGQILNELIPDSFFVNGQHSVTERNEAIKRFISGEIKCMIASNIFNEGVSINCIKCLIIASAGLSEIETIQKIGRALRIDEGKKEAFVFDFDDFGNIFLERHSQKRRSIYEKLGFEVI